MAKVYSPTLTLPQSINVTIGRPLDTRTVVAQYSDLSQYSTNDSTFEGYEYVGMLVYVQAEQQFYVISNIDSNTREITWSQISIPQLSEDVEGKLLTVEKVNIGTAEAPVYKYEAQWADAPSGLPTISQNDANKILQVNANGNGVAWVDTPDELPSFTTSDKGKVLTVSSDGNTAEWQPIIHPSELPAKTDNELKFLQVSADGKSVQWAESLPYLQEDLRNISFLGNDTLGRTTWKHYQFRGTYSDLMFMKAHGQLVPGGTYILEDYKVVANPEKGIIDIFDDLFEYISTQIGTGDDNITNYHRILNAMIAKETASLVDIVLRADSTNSFERKAKMTTKSREVISEIAHNIFSSLENSAIDTIINKFMSILPNITADVEIELNNKVDFNEVLLYGIGDTITGSVYPTFRGLIKYMKDSFGNEMPFDFKTVLTGQDRRYMFSIVNPNETRGTRDNIYYIREFNLSNSGRMRNVRFIIDDEYYEVLGKIIVGTNANNSIFNYTEINYHREFQLVGNISAFNSGSLAYINNVEIHNNPFFISNTLINGLKIFNDDKSLPIKIIQDVETIMERTPGITLTNIFNASLILNNVIIKNSNHFINTLYDNVTLHGNSFTFPIDPRSNKPTQLEIRKILRNLTIDLPNNFNNYRLLMNSDYLESFDVLQADYPSICAFDHLIDISNQMADLIKAKSDQLESTSEAYNSDLHKQGGHNDFNENLIRKTLDPIYKPLMAPLSFGEFLGFKYATTDTSSGESPVFSLLNLLRDAEKIYRLVTNSNGELVFKLQVPQFDDTPSTSVVELGL